MRLPRIYDCGQISLVDLGSETGKRRAAYPGPEGLDRKTIPLSPRTFLQGCGTETGLPSIVQHAMPVGSLGPSVLRRIQTLPICVELTFSSCLSEPNQVTPDEIFNVGHPKDNTQAAEAPSAFPRVESPSRFSIAKNIVSLNASNLSGAQHGTERPGFETREYLWPNEQGSAMPNPEACAGPQTPVGSLLCAANPPFAWAPHVPSCITADMGLMDNATGGLHNCGMPSDPFQHALASPESPRDLFGRALDNCEAAGYSSVNSTPTEYHALFFPTTTDREPTQMCSNSRNPPRVPDSPCVAPLPCSHERRNLWPHNEPKRFREQVLRLAENVLTSEMLYTGSAHGDQSASAARVLVDQNTGGMASDGYLTISRRDARATRIGEGLKPYTSHWLTTSYMKGADA